MKLLLLSWCRLGRCVAAAGALFVASCGAAWATDSGWLSGDVCYRNQQDATDRHFQSLPHAYVPESSGFVQVEFVKAGTPAAPYSGWDRVEYRWATGNATPTVLTTTQQSYPVLPLCDTWSLSDLSTIWGLGFFTPLALWFFGMQMAAVSRVVYRALPWR